MTRRFALIVALAILWMSSVVAQGTTRLYLPLLAVPGAAGAPEAPTATSNAGATAVPSATTAATRTPTATNAPTTTNTPGTTPTTTNTPTATSKPGTTPTATNTPTLPPSSFTSCSVVGKPSSAAEYPVQIVDIDKDLETVTLVNVSSSTVSLADWKMCSVTGGQHHPISGSLAPQQQKTFTNTGGPIWNNDKYDPGALWDNKGRLISYHDDPS